MIAKDGIWGGFCYNNFSVTTGEILCQQLGFVGYVSHSCCFRDLQINNKIWVTKSLCTGQENLISQCQLSFGLNADKCSGNVRLRCASKFTII